MIGRIVRIEPLSIDHASSLFRNTGGDAELWKWVLTKFPIPTTEFGMRSLIEQIIAESGISREPFAIIRLSDNEVVGSSSYMDIDQRLKNLEIGSTFYSASARRTSINTETKLLLLTEAFENRGFERVQIKADNLNERSLRAIERIGATYEGTLRSHMTRRDGTRRDTVVYSILRHEWPEIKARIELLLKR